MLRDTLSIVLCVEFGVIQTFVIIFFILCFSGNV